MTDTLADLVVAGIQAELSVLRDEFTAWRGRSCQDTMRQHRTQILRITEQLEGALAAATEQSALDIPGPARDFPALQGLRHAVQVVHLIWDFFRDRLTQRDAVRYAEHLEVADELAWACYAPFVEAFVAGPGAALSPEQLKTPPLVAYVPEWSPSAQSRHSAYIPAGLDEVDVKRFDAALARLPVPIISVPWAHARSVPPLCLVAHEVGHVVWDDLALGPAAHAGVAALELPGERKAAWCAWLPELFADVIGVLGTGASYVGQLAVQLATSVGKVATESPDASARYPTRSLRMAFCNGVLVVAGAQPPTAWVAAYGSPTDPHVADIPDVVKVLVDTRYAALGGLRVRDVLTWSADLEKRCTSAALRFGQGLDPTPPFSVRVWVAGAAQAHATDEVRYRKRDADIAREICARSATGVRSESVIGRLSAVGPGTSKSEVDAAIAKHDRAAGRKLAALLDLVPPSRRNPMKPEDVIQKIKTRGKQISVSNTALGVAYTRWLVEGDVPLSEADLRAYATDRVRLAERVTANPAVKKDPLIAIEKGGKILRWAPGKTLDYCVWKPSFDGNTSEYDRVVRDLHTATEHWSAICGVRFEHRSALDDKPDLKLGECLFPVLRHKGGGSTVAMAFFPDSPVAERLMWVFDGHFSGTSGFDPIGVLRHELGHVLGFRHEHIVPEAPDYFDPEDTEHIHRLSAYDPQSVMHYVAPGVGNPTLTFTELDKSSAKRVYGHPHDDFTYQAE